MLALGLVGLACILLVAAMTLSAAVVASHRARTAADLGALAGAMAVPPSCAEADRIVRRHGAHLAACTVDGAFIEIETRVSPGVGHLGPAIGRARAGPAP
ncbi:MAG: flp pilus-assembly TadE/G-like family protein [Mobilicoccus sp.]|nr:flp pilus-assembly TadE/G-like family protein [Mobilicoccus sp.]